MSHRTYIEDDGHDDEPLVWLRGEVKTPPFSAAARIAARIEAGMLLRRLQEGDRLGMPHSRPILGLARGAMSFV